MSAGLADVCSLLRERSQLALPRLVADGFVADAAFVDGSHIFHNVFVDLFFLRQLVHPGGLVILDDCPWPSVATAARYFEVNTGWQPEPIEQDTRLCAYRLPDPRVEPGFESFEPFGLDTPLQMTPAHDSRPQAASTAGIAGSRRLHQQRAASGST